MPLVGQRWADQTAAVGETEARLIAQAHVLTPAVAGALVEYLRQRPPECEAEHVFLRARAPSPVPDKQGSYQRKIKIGEIDPLIQRSLEVGAAGHMDLIRVRSRLSY